MSYYIDSHCHLNFKAFKNDWREVAERAFSSGVKSIINVGSNYETSQKAIEIACQNNILRLSPTVTHGEAGGSSRQARTIKSGKLYAAIGLHPIHVNDEEFDTSRYQNLINNCHCEEPQQGNEAISGKPHLNPPLTKGRRRRGVVAIGETGIDLYHNKSTLVKQSEVFRASIDLANKNSLPIIIHNRNAKNEVLEMLRNHPPKFGGVMHCFSENWDYAQKILELGLYISFTATITFNNISDDILEVVEKIPIEKILIETDSPYIIPRRQKNKKIKRNEPAFVIEVIKKIAEIKNIDIDKVASQTTQTTTNLFNLSS